jgi:hypothetical protein
MLLRWSGLLCILSWSFIFLVQESYSQPNVTGLQEWTPSNRDIVQNNFTKEFVTQGNNTPGGLSGDMLQGGTNLTQNYSEVPLPPPVNLSEGSGEALILPEEWASDLIPPNQ